jgi:hypothetical protein
LSGADTSVNCSVCGKHGNSFSINTCVDCRGKFCDTHSNEWRPRLVVWSSGPDGWLCFACQRQRLRLLRRFELKVFGVFLLFIVLFSLVVSLLERWGLWPG